MTKSRGDHYAQKKFPGGIGRRSGLPLHFTDVDDWLFSFSHLCGYRWAMLVYLVVALLSIFVVPDKQAAMIFVFLGYYPVLKDYLDHHMKSRAMQWIIKFAVFNLSILAAYGLMIYVFQMPDVMTEMGTLGQFTGLVTLLAGNIVFIVFELALTRIFYFYRHFFRPHFLRKVK